MPRNTSAGRDRLKRSSGRRADQQAAIGPQTLWLRNALDQRDGIEDVDVTLLDFEQVLFYQSCKNPTHGFELHSKIAANVCAGHLEYHFCAREAVGMKSLDKVKQKDSKSFVRPHTAKHQHCLLRTHNLASHDSVDMVLQLLYQRRPLCDPIKRQQTNLGILKCDDIAAVVVIHDAVKAENFAGHPKARDLLSTKLQCRAGLEKTTAYSVKPSEIISVLKQCFIAP